MPQARISTLSTNEHEVLKWVWLLGRNAYGLAIFDCLNERLSLGKIYVIFESLERKGLVTLQSAEPTPERGDRPKLFARITPAGEKELSVNI